MSLKDREEGFERKFAHDEELKFKAMARRNKLLGLWAAEKLGKNGDEDVFRKIRKDFDEGGVQQSDHQIRRTMEELLATAVRQIEAS